MTNSAIAEAPRDVLYHLHMIITSVMACSRWMTFKVTQGHQYRRRRGDAIGCVNVRLLISNRKFN